MKYEFVIPYRQFKAGDTVPEHWDAGLVGTMLQSHRIRHAEGEKAVTESPEDKMLSSRRVKRKEFAK